LKKYCRVGLATDGNMAHERIARWIPKTTDTHSACVIPIDFALQHWLHERAAMLRS